MTLSHDLRGGQLAPLTYGSLFTGIGGFDLGFDRAGMNCMWQVENDKNCQRVLARHWPGVIRMEDVRSVTGQTVSTVDLICGGFPCQDVSVAGRRAGLVGERSGLWFEFHRILAEMRPRWCVIENVPGLLSSNNGRDFAVILRGLVECGYGVCWRVLDSQYFGVAQRRRRVFIIGHLGDGRAAQVLFERDGGGGDNQAGRKAGEVAPATPASGAETGRTENERTEVEMLVAFSGGQSAKARSLALGKVSPPIRGGASGTNQVPTIAGAVSAKWAKGTGGPAGDEAYNLIAFSNRGAEGVETLRADSHGDSPMTMTWDKAQVTSKEHRSRPSPISQPLNSAGEMMVGVRRLTPTECERLQGFPDGHTGGQVDSVRYRQLGNAVTVNVAEWIGRRIMQVEETLS